MKLLKSAVALTLALASSLSTAQTFLLTSPDFAPGKAFADKFLFNGMGCTGDNVSPALKWENPPPGTKSFALMVHDPGRADGWRRYLALWSLTFQAMRAPSSRVPVPLMESGCLRQVGKSTMTTWG